MQFRKYLNSKLEDKDFANIYAETSKTVNADMLKVIWNEGYTSIAKSVLENPYSLNKNPEFHYKWREGFESKGKTIKYVRDKK